MSHAKWTVLVTSGSTWQNWPHVRPMIAVQALWAFMGPFGDYILSSFLTSLKNSLHGAVGLQIWSDVKNLKIAYFSAGAILDLYLIFFLQRTYLV